MRSVLAWSVLFLSLANPGWSGSSVVPQDDILARELKSLAGTWRPISAENNGYKASEADLKGIHWIRNADGNWFMQRDDKILVGWAIRKIDATKAPKTIDVEITMGSYSGTIYLGIYDLEGDTLRLCFALPDRPVRPTEFSADKGSVRALTLFKREDVLPGK